MSMLVNKPVRAQIALYYTPTRVAEMHAHNEKNCDALFTFVRDIVESYGGIITDSVTPLQKDRQVDLLLTISVENNDKLQKIKKILDTMSSGARKISVFPI